MYVIFDLIRDEQVQTTNPQKTPGCLEGKKKTGHEKWHQPKLVCGFNPSEKY